ncbi:MAG: shikimate dehydrogenase [Sphingomonadaceae bacterium]|jgi:shikimate dehydrogenase|nr:shikimate dehydrogenase [Sphingomonadaceae bacterium]NBU78922.1 shikimate dehydrogenase [Sphingomonadaceae bacterium]NCA00874.1 shikimate dehydrogenase [Sphingomonadaceae bacterium]
MSRPYAEVIGDPISHSKSPRIHGFWLEALGIEAEYRATHVTPEGLADFVAARAQDADWRGCNVTLPHKLAVMDHVGDPGDVRASIGAMNTIARDEAGRLFGTNTDAGGFYGPIADVPLAGAPVIVAGTGGAAHAVLFALSRLDVGPVTLLARSPLKGAALLARFGLKGEVRPIDAALPPAQLFVNTTSLGMTGQPPLAPDLSPLPDDAVVYDIVYAPLVTPLLAAAEARGLHIVDGLEMLVGQAAIAFELFFGATPPRDRDDELREILLA